MREQLSGAEDNLKLQKEILTMNITRIKHLAKIMIKASNEELLAAEEIINFVESAKIICLKSEVCSQEDYPLLWASLIDRLKDVDRMELKMIIEDLEFLVDGGEVVDGEAIPMKVWLKK